MQEERTEEVRTTEDLAETVEKLQQQLRDKELESYKLKRLSELGLKPSYASFLQGKDEQQFEKSLESFLEEQKKAIATAGLKKAPRGPGTKRLSSEETVREQILTVGRRRLH